MARPFAIGTPPVREKELVCGAGACWSRMLANETTIVKCPSDRDGAPQTPT